MTLAVGGTLNTKHITLSIHIINTEKHISVNIFRIRNGNLYFLKTKFLPKLFLFSFFLSHPPISFGAYLFLSVFLPTFLVFAVLSGMPAPLGLTWDRQLVLGSVS